MNNLGELSRSMPQLGGTRVWLSGSLPEQQQHAEERAAISDFVSRFAATVFQSGGHIIHGAHPSLTPALLSQARAYQESGGKRDCLTLVVSRLWSKKPQAIPIEDWRKICTVYETPESRGANPQDESLTILRNWVASRCDAFVGVGGEWWKAVSGRAGVPTECDLAIERCVPCFLIGGLGGAAQTYVNDHPELLRHLRNGLDESANRVLATSRNVRDLAQQVCEQLGRLPVLRGRVSDGTSFRILALDGGGIKGTFTAAVIASWEARTGLKVADHFDLIAGTSTGGIIAIGIGLGVSGQKILEFYRDRGSVIFPLTSFARRICYGFRHLIRPKFSQEVLLRELEAAFYRGRPPLRLRESKCRLVIPAYHAVAGLSHIFRTPHHPLLTRDADTEAAHAALATAAAPTYFSAAKVGSLIAESNYFDGGVWANCPAMAAIVEAVCYLGVPLGRIDVLSVGTTEGWPTHPAQEQPQLFCPFAVPDLPPEVRAKLIDLYFEITDPVKMAEIGTFLVRIRKQQISVTSGCTQVLQYLFGAARHKALGRPPGNDRNAGFCLAKQFRGQRRRNSVLKLPPDRSAIVPVLHLSATANRNWR